MFSSFCRWKEAFQRCNEKSSFIPLKGLIETFPLAAKVNDINRRLKKLPYRFVILLLTNSLRNDRRGKGGGFGLMSKSLLGLSPP